MSTSMLFHVTHGPADPERATIPFVAATVAAASGIDATIVATIDGVWLGTHNGAAGVQTAGQAPLEELITSFVAAGGSLWLCSACTVPRDIGEDDCREGAVIVGAAAIVEAIANGAQSVSLS